MTIYRGYMWYYICTDDNGNYSYWKPSPLFEVFDGRMSKYWVYACEKESPYEATWAYPEWANDPYYYHFLTDWEEEYVAHFKHYKKLMDREFPDPSVEEKAEIGDETWLICPLCIDAWESNSPDAMVACPKCKKVFHNPRYIQNNPPGGSFILSNQET
ncbi:MAG: hypothetical protein CK425_10550 [Parachlamydia sp.]|nr:MAG: hypothetical protein CK425_10550 [Parachlamydia sp.]